ncbi:hypothetical protein [Myroides guanonis]|uniref:Uncharacterized protein n=1 Tax=Myroides guanonis TaxID=1150112 RepID=A0A1I3QQM0_9FLAO|nr:hypothetical protein [Myroides guanonis]SFJ36175.1 hypothetical protein SAMN04487893_10680 [Myroides guanonis]
MRNSLILLILLTSLFSCITKNEKIEVVEEEKVFVTYELSPMASLMERMYAESLLMKGHIVEKNTNVVVSTDFIKELEFAALTVPSDKDAFFEIQMKEFVDLYTSLESQEVIKKESYNAMIQSCLSCHQVKCTGPIERIKKLIIK